MQLSGYQTARIRAHTPQPFHLLDISRIVFGQHYSNCLG